MAHSQYQSIHLNRITPFNLDMAIITFNLTSDALKYPGCWVWWIDMFQVTLWEVLLLQYLECVFSCLLSAWAHTRVHINYCLNKVFSVFRTSCPDNEWFLHAVYTVYYVYTVCTVHTVYTVIATYLMYIKQPATVIIFQHPLHSALLHYCLSIFDVVYIYLYLCKVV